MVKITVKSKGYEFQAINEKFGFFLKTKAFHNKRFKEARHQAGH